LPCLTQRWSLRSFIFFISFSSSGSVRVGGAVSRAEQVLRASRQEAHATLGKETLLIVCTFPSKTPQKDHPSRPHYSDPNFYICTYRDCLTPKLFIHLPRSSSIFQLLPSSPFLSSQLNSLTQLQLVSSHLAIVNYTACYRLSVYRRCRLDYLLTCFESRYHLHTILDTHEKFSASPRNHIVRHHDTSFECFKEAPRCGFTQQFRNIWAVLEFSNKPCSFLS
jgi:hypothetical protein